MVEKKFGYFFSKDYVVNNKDVGKGMLVAKFMNEILDTLSFIPDEYGGTSHQIILGSF